MKRDPWDARARTARGIVLGLSPYRSAREGRDSKPRRFITQTHALGGAPSRSRSLLVAGLIAVALYMIGRRLSR